MSEVRSNGYMAQLDAWTKEAIIAPLYEAWAEVEHAPEEPFITEAQDTLLHVVADVKRAVRERVLESYRNGQAAGPRQPASRVSAPAHATRRFEPPF